MPAYERLKSLGEDRFRSILNMLMRGEPAMGVARVVQHEWKEFQDVGEKTLTQQLNRLRMDAVNGAFGKKLAQEIIKTQSPVPQIMALEDVSCNVIARMEELATFQLDRVKRLIEKETKDLAPSAGPLLAATNAVFNDYSKLLQDLQKLRFDLGLDQFKGVVSGFKASNTSLTLPDGTGIQRQVIEAVTTLEEVFNRHDIPKVITQG